MSYLVHGFELGDNAPPPLDTTDQQAKDRLAQLVASGTTGVLTGGAAALQQIASGFFPGQTQTQAAPPPPQESVGMGYTIPVILLLGVGAFAVVKAVKKGK